jgi:hypothetical protein
MITPSYTLTATERVLSSLALDFTTANLDSRVAFTRATSASNPATYVESIGVIAAATNDQPRFDFDPVTLACRGLLIEESRTNIMLYSQQLDNVVWQKAGLNTTGTPPYVNVVISPDGTQNAEKIIEDTSTGSHNLRQTYTGSVSTTYTYSFFAKAAERSRLNLFVGGPGVTANYDLAAGTCSGTGCLIQRDTSTALVCVWFSCLVSGCPNSPWPDRG